MSDRITGSMSIGDMVEVMTEGDRGADFVLRQVFFGSEARLFGILHMDSKRLYGRRIWDLYEACGKDLDRFLYHLEIELPNQETGKLSITGPHTARVKEDPDFWTKRSFGKPGSFWALQDPPTDPNYEYPIL